MHLHIFFLKSLYAREDCGFIIYLLSLLIILLEVWSVTIASTLLIHLKYAFVQVVFVVRPCFLVRYPR
jgi:hypothetical protein